MNKSGEKPQDGHPAGRMRLRVLRRGVLSVLVALLMLASVVAPAHATYIYVPGEFMYMKNSSGTTRCTGAYMMVLGGQMYLLTAGHCGPSGVTVANRGWNIGHVAINGYRASGSSFSGWDTAGVKLTHPDSAAWQFVIDPPTRTTVAPDPWIRSLTPTKNLVQGFVVVKGGTTTGTTRGPVTAYTRWGLDIAYCAQMRTLPGDSGGPVFRWEGNHLAATGVVVAYAAGGNVGCFIPIDEILRRWGGYLPSLNGPLYPNPQTPPPILPAADDGAGGAEFNGLKYLDPSEVHSAELG